MDEIVAPDRPLMVARSFDSSYREPLRFERGDHGLVWFEQPIVYTASHPQQTKVRLLRVGLRKVRDGFGIEAGGEGTDPGKELRVHKTGEQALMSPHGKTGDGAVLPLLGYVIIGLDLRDYFGDECLLIEVVVLFAQFRSAPGLEHS